MKVRLTIMTENDRPRANNGVTEELIAKVWQEIFDTLALFTENNDKATVEKVEFLTDGDRRCEECKHFGAALLSTYGTCTAYGVGVSKLREACGDFEERDE